MGELHVKGMHEVLAKLRALPEAVQKQCLDPGIRRIASVLAKEVRANVDRDHTKTGKLRKSVRVVRQVLAWGWFYVSAGKGARYAHIVERGSAPHVIRGRLHPGSRPMSFMRRAFDSHAGRALKLGIAVMKRKFKVLKI